MTQLIALMVSMAGLGLVLYLLLSKRQKPWNEMTLMEQKKKKILIVSGTTVFLTGLLVSLFPGKKK